jgi:ribosomal protein S18 acetylase RimI-like enzyme
VNWLRNLRDGALTARPAVAADRPAVSALLASTRRRYGIAALEEQVALLNGGASAVAFDGSDLIGFLGLNVRLPAGDPPEVWADLEMAASAGSASPGKTFERLLQAAAPALAAQGVTAIFSLTNDSWLCSALAENGFAEEDRVVSYARPGKQPPSGASQPAALRPIRPEDADTVLDLNAAAFEPIWRYDPAATLAWLMASEHAVIAEYHGRSAGFALTSTPMDGEYAQLIRVAVHPDVQGRGIGRQLVADAIRFAFAGGYGGVSLNTQASNGIAQHLYRSLGFYLLPGPLSVMVRRS